MNDDFVPLQYAKIVLKLWKRKMYQLLTVVPLDIP